MATLARAGGHGAARRRHVGHRPRLPVRPGGAPGDGRPVAVRGSAASFFGASGGPSRPRPRPARSPTILAEFRDRLAGGQMNAQHPRQFGYFTPPPLPVSMMGELLAQMTNQGVDVWHAGPLATFVEEEVVRWLCDLIGYGSRSFGLLTSGGVMANFMGMTLARDIHLGRLLGAGRAPRGAMLDGVRVYTSDQTHFSIARALDLLGFPPETLVVIPSDERFRLHGAPVADGRRPRPRRRAPSRSRSRRSSARPTRARSTSSASWPTSPRREDLWLHVDAAYGGGGAAVGARSRPGARPRARGFGHRRSAQVVLPGLRHRRPAGPRRGAPGQVFGGRAPEYYRGGETPAAGTADAADHDDHGDQLNFYKLSFEGTRRWRALKLWMSWKHLGTEGLRPPRRGQRRPGRPARPALCRVRRLRGDPGDAGALGRVLPPPAGRRDAAMRWRPTRSTRTRTAPGGTRGVRRRLADDDPAARRDLAACRDRQLPLDRGRHRRLLATLRRLAADT